MLTVFWFSLAVLFSAASVAWILDHEGSILIQWLGYQVDIEVSMAILIVILLVLVIFSMTYLLARILAFKFPNLLKIFARKRHIRHLECQIDRQNRVLAFMPDLLLALEGDDPKLLKKLEKKILKISENNILNDFLSDYLSDKRQED